MLHVNDVRTIATIYPIVDEIQIKGVNLKYLFNFNSIYEYIKPLGKGGAGTVRCYRSRGDHNLYALKEIPITPRTNIPALKNEVEMLTQLSRGPGQDQAIMTYYDSFVYHNGSQLIYIIVTEYIVGCSLFDYVNQMIDLNLAIPAGVLFGIAIWLFETLARIHKSGYAHRDLKPENIMIDVKKRRLVLIDFGLTCNFKKKSKRSKELKLYSLVGTPAYIAPERWHRPKLSPRSFFSSNPLASLKKVDVWAAGITLYCLSEQKLPWQHENIAYMIKEIRGNNPIEYGVSNAHFVGVLKLALHRDPHSRLSAEEMSRAFKLSLYQSNGVGNPANLTAELSSDRMSLSDGGPIFSLRSDDSMENDSWHMPPFATNFSSLDPDLKFGSL